MGNKGPKLKSLFAVLCILFLAAFLGGCSGDDGKDGTNGTNGLSAYEIAVQNGFTGTEQEWLDSLAAKGITPLEAVAPESCSICHNGEIIRNGDSHQEAYDELFQHGVVVVSDLDYSGAGGNDTVMFKMTKNGAAFDCRQADSLNLYFTQYTGTNDMEFTAPDDGTGSDRDGDRLSIKGTVTYDAASNTCTSTKAQSSLGDLSTLNGLIIVYGQDELVESISAAHISLARYPFAAILEMGTVGYVSAANATGCEHCHTTPYYKHGYILADVSQGGGMDFYTCKACHIDNGSGGHTDWQYSVDDPFGWATGAATTADYSYKTRLMNDVHMSHFMEFPYPQSPLNCNTCHADKLAQTLDDSNFVIETCKSCHPITGGTDLANADGEFAVDTRDRALMTIWENKGVAGFHSVGLTCNTSGCHTAGGGGKRFNELHTGYNPVIYDTNGAKYADGITVSIDSASVSGNDLTFSASATGSVGGLSAADIVPLVMVSFYGYDTKDFLVSCHTRDANSNRMEFTLGSADNALFTTVANNPGSWTVTLHMGAYVATATPSIPELIASGIVKRAEIAVLPTLKNADGDTLGLNAPSRTFDLTANAFQANYFQGTNAIVDEANGCNTCHDQLATTFHSGNRGGNIVVCRMCHVVTNGGSHLEGQSRSIDSYAHAVHRFQAFDIEDIDFSDPVEKKHYEEHIEFLFPNFATINCMACHKAGKFNVPDQSKSMPGLLSATEEIPGVVPISSDAVVTGPAARACGGCHRAQFLKENDAQGALAFNEHTRIFGYRVESSLLYDVIEKIMSLFN